MSLLVLKFGGSSIATINRINNVANIISNLKNKGNDLIVVTSAMQGVTDKLLDYTKEFKIDNYNNAFYRESDAIVSCGESIAAGILSLALQSIGIKAQSFNAWQIPIEASSNYSNATITNIKTDILFEALKNNITPVITGFQGLSSNNDIVTLGRGGSDATACALAYYANADECYIYTDVSGVFTADPRVVTNAQILEYISYDAMLELAKYGAKVLQYKSVLLAKQYKVKVRVLSSFTSDSLSSLVTNKTKYINNKKINRHNINLSLVKDNKNMTDTELHTPKIAGIAHSTKHVLLNTATNINNILDKYEIINIQNNNYLVKKSILNNIINLLKDYTVDNDIGTITIVGNINNNLNITNKCGSENFNKINMNISNIDNGIGDKMENNNLRTVKISIANGQVMNVNNSVDRGVEHSNFDKIDGINIVSNSAPYIDNMVYNGAENFNKINTNISKVENTDKGNPDYIKVRYYNDTDENRISDNQVPGVENFMSDGEESFNNISIELDEILNKNNINIKYKFVDNISITYVVHLSQTEIALNIIHKYIYE